MTYYENQSKVPALNKKKSKQDKQRIQPEDTMSCSNNEDVKNKLKKIVQNELQRQYEYEMELEQDLEQKQKGQLQTDNDKVIFGNIGNNKVFVYVVPID